MKRHSFNASAKSECSPAGCGSIRAVEQVTQAAHELLGALVTNAPPRDREVEAVKARARSAERYGSSNSA